MTILNFDLIDAPTRFTFQPELLLKLKIEALLQQLMEYTYSIKTNKKHTS